MRTGTVLGGNTLNKRHKSTINVPNNKGATGDILPPLMTHRFKNGGLSQAASSINVASSRGVDS